jgi:hypothetical protein
MVIIPAAELNKFQDTETADKLSAAGSAKVTEQCKIRAKYLIGMPAYIHFEGDGFKAGEEPLLSADAYSQVFGVFAAKWGKKGIEGRRIQFFAGADENRAEDAAAFGGFYLGLAAFRETDVLRLMCVYPALQLRPHHALMKLKVFLAEVQGANFDALEATYASNEIPRLQNVLRTTMVALCTNKFYTNDADSRNGPAAAQEAMGRLHRLEGKAEVDANFEQFTVTAEGPIKGQSGLRARVDIKKGASFRIAGNVFSKFDPKNDADPKEYNWDLTHDLVLRCQGLVKFINDPKDVEGSDPKGNVEVKCEVPRDCLYLVAKKDIQAGATIWLVYGVTFWNPNAMETEEPSESEEEA